MKEQLSENIRALRKSAGIRQEELAEALGVSVGAVSKWERGAAAPDLRYMIALAQVFGVSTDALLGFELGNTAQDACVDRILALLKAHKASESLTAADEALRRYPNSFQIVHTGALAYYLHTLDAPLLKRYDCILVLKNRRIAEVGTFDELMARRDYFYSLYTVFPNNAYKKAPLRLQRTAGENFGLISLGASLYSSSNAPVYRR